MDIAAFFARIVGRGRSTLGAGGGGAATCGDAASAERSCADGMTAGGVSPSVRVRVPGTRGAWDVLGENADIIAAENECRCIGAQTPCEWVWEPKRRATCCARYMRAREEAMVVGVRGEVAVRWSWSWKESEGKEREAEEPQQRNRPGQAPCLGAV